MAGSEHSLKAESIILRHSDWGEADRLLVVLTRERGKLRAIAKGARKLTSRKAGHLEPFTYAVLQFSRGRDFWIVTQADTRKAFSHIREELLLTSFSLYCIELCERFTTEEQENRQLFDLLESTLTRIDSDIDPFIVVRYFEIKLLDLVGYRPQLFKCVQCDKDILPEDQYFSAEHGGVVCPRCSRDRISNKPISLETLKFLRHFQRNEFVKIQKVTTPTQIRQEMEAIMQYYLTYLLERKLNSPDFLHLMQQTTTK
jgi:DNA repair protein RecO (recombination protein O)